ncbi:microtubule-associated proteins 1A/1B light chain 3C-like isoform X1 [Grus americana]|uniref:microtubule-associated proteins 1A/1B light chain 3C-like isoform X1 n=1 Tax=Grus americana TaxID=9117 RepID=UPI002407FD28|nr:microtubule-associated proteins 1A/1B light chain 3C-like isoform X1 [Grus americana]XP_054663848.1 microtubule-associated proteins 1A/1B light chain 3C-like isoform X1 [Grus americana]
MPKGEAVRVFAKDLVGLDSENRSSAAQGGPAASRGPESPSSTFSPPQVVVERYQKEKTLPPLNRTKFLVSQDLPLSQFAVTLRTRLCLASSQTFYLLVNNKGLPNMAVTMQELYRDNKDEDGFLYLTYASQEMFGSSSSSEPTAA